MTIGQRLKTLRKARSMTLQQVSNASGLSIGYLSNLERDLTSPTISSLFKLCDILGEDVSTFLQPFEKKTHIVKRDERKTVYYFKSSKIRYESITQKGVKLKGYCITISPGGVSGGNYNNAGQYHNSDEIGIIHQGSLEITIGNETYCLDTGDAFYVEANHPHYYRNNGDEDCVLYCITN